VIKVHYKHTEEKFKTLVHRESNEFKPVKGNIMYNVSRLDGYDKPKVYKFTVDKIFEDKESYLEEYGNRFAEVDTERVTIVVETEGDKVRLSYYYMNNFRKVGKRFFAKVINRYYLTYNLKTDNFYLTSAIKPLGQRMHRKVTCNNFKMIDRYVNEPEFIKSGDRPYLKIFLDLIDPENTYSGDPSKFDEALINIFIKRNGIKGPNHMVSMMKYNYLGKRLLRKSDNNIVHSILDYMGIKSKYFIRLYNKFSVDSDYLTYYVKLLGLKYVRTINSEFFRYEHSPYGYLYNAVKKINFEAAERLYGHVEDYERKNVVKVINDFVKNRHNNKIVSGRFDRNLTGLIQDHIDIIRKLRKYDDTIKFRATTVREFDEEHNNYSSLDSMYRTSEEVHYMYGKDLIETVNGISNGCEYHLLKDTNDYIMESTRQSNCVRTYVDKFRSIIISVRKDDDWVTTEFNYNGDCIQKRGRFNENPSDKMVPYIEELEVRIKNLKRQGKLIPPNIKVHNKMTHQENIYSFDEATKLSIGSTDFDDFLEIEFDDILM